MDDLCFILFAGIFSIFYCEYVISFYQKKRDVNKILGGKAKKSWQTQLATVTERSNVIQEIFKSPVCFLLTSFCDPCQA